MRSLQKFIWQYEHYLHKNFSCLLKIPMQIGRREPFSLFIPKHRKIASKLIDIFMGEFKLLSLIARCNDELPKDRCSQFN